MTLTYIDWEGCIRLDEDGIDCSPMVRIYFEADGYEPYVPATWDHPAEGGYFEGIQFIRAEIDPNSLPAAPLTDAEIAAARAWFATREALEDASDAATEAMETSP